MLNQCLESLVQKVQSGVVINFEKTGPDPPLVGEGEFLHDAHSVDLTTCASPVFKIVMDKFEKMKCSKKKKMHQCVISFWYSQNISPVKSIAECIKHDLNGPCSLQSSVFY